MNKNLREKIKNKDGILCRKRFDGKLIPMTQVGGPSRTKTEFTEECDINVILKKWKEKTAIPELREGGYYADFSNIQSFDDAVDIVTNAQNEFNELPADTRSYFENNPQKLVDFLGIEDNKEKAIELGLIKAPKSTVKIPAIIPRKKAPTEPKTEDKASENPPKEA